MGILLEPPVGRECYVAACASHRITDDRVAILFCTEFSYLIAYVIIAIEPEICVEAHMHRKWIPIQAQLYGMYLYLDLVSSVEFWVIVWIVFRTFCRTVILVAR